MDPPADSGTYRCIDELHNSIEEYIEDAAVEGSDVEYGQGVLTIKLGAKGTFVLNKQTPNKQIWLSSPVSGPFRYDFVGGEWIYNRDGHSLHKKLSEELQNLVGAPLHL
eukprot:jgi/Tetstr1/457751/TSEL_044296.t1